MRNKVWIAAAFSIALIAAGCTPEARQDVGQAGQKVGEATEKSAQGTAQAVGQAGEKMQAGAQKAAEATKTGAQQVGEAVGGAVNQVGKPMQMTPAVKGALVANKQIDASTLNVDTNVDAKTVTIKGTQPTPEKKALVTQVAEKAVKDTDPSFKVINQVTVPPKS
jgi:hypothetical protein